MKCRAMFVAAVVGAPVSVLGQSLYERGTAPASTPQSTPAAPAPSAPAPAGTPAGQPGAVAPAATAPASAPQASAGGASRLSAPRETTAALQGVSLFLVTPPPPRTYQKNDLIEIIINETSQQQSDQKLDTKKDYTTRAELSKFPSLRNLWEAQLKNGDSQAKANLEVTSNNEFKGDGKYNRNDRFTARITAVVIEVKPNGTLVLEARKQVTANKEETTLVLSGLCRPEDISTTNTVQSSQLANMMLTTKNEGDVKDASKKGIIPQILDTIFNF